MKKPIAAALFCLMLCLALTAAGCARDPRLDCFELNARLRAADRAFAFPEDDLYFADGTYYAFYSVYAPRDLLLAMRADETGRLTRVSLTVSRMQPQSAEAFFPLALAVASCFIPACDTAALREALMPGDAPAFTLSLRRYTQGRYSAALFTSDGGACFTAELAEDGAAA